VSERIFVTGMGILSSVGSGPEPFIDALLAGASGVADVTRFDTSSCRSHRAAKLENFDAATYIAPAKLRRMDEVGRLAVAGARLAVRDAGIDLSANGTDDIGVTLGSFTAGIHSTVEYLTGLVTEGVSGSVPLIFSNTVPNAPASLCAIELGLRGPNCTVSHKEASALGALALAESFLKTSRARAMLAGGADDVEATFFRVHDRFRVLSPVNGGDEVARPFDRRRNGYVLGDGAFVLLLEQESSARARDARVYGEILGTGATASPCALNQWPRDPSQLARAMRLAIENARLLPDDVDVVLGAGNGAQVLDRLEAAAIQDVFCGRPVPVVSIKGAIGESGAAGAASIAAALLALGKGVVPPTVGFAEADPECPANVSSSAREATGARSALINAFASGGTNYSVVVRR